MKKLFTVIFLYMAILPFAKAVSNHSLSSDTVTTVIIMHDISPDDRPRMPELNPLSFTCYAIESANCILLASNNSVRATVRIENRSTGNYTQYSTRVSYSPISLGLLGPGEYHMTISLSDGNVYSGKFEL